MPDNASAKREAAATIDRIAEELTALSHAIHARPELCYEEHFAAAELAQALRRHGVPVEAPAFDLPTSFVGRCGTTGPHIVICCEYDALPGIGHGCGHNIIGTAGVGAGIALAPLAQALGGRVTILGTPAEEGGGGKLLLLQRGAFTDADAAMMIHPEPANVEIVPYLANETLIITMHGKAAHASSSARAGVNALDALVLGYQGAQILKGLLRPDERVFGIITNGGDADNVIPAEAVARYRIRARNVRRLDRLRDRLTDCFQGAATQIGATCTIESLGGYRDLRANRALAAAFRTNAEALGRSFLEPAAVPIEAAGSTDMGNVSHALPTIHPVLDIGTRCAGHTIEMTAASITPAADQCLVDGAKAMAATVIDYWTQPDLRERVAQEWVDRDRTP
jgi:amidohydrolase